MANDSLEMLRKRAKEAIARGDLQEALRIYERAITYRSDNVEMHYGIATVCFLLEDLPRAAEHFREVIRLDPMRANAHINLGAVYDRMEQFAEAMAALQRGVQLDPGRAEGYYNLAVACKHSGNLDKAIEAYRNAIRIAPTMYDAYYNLGNILFEKREYAMAVNEYQQALKLRPDCEKTKSAFQGAQARLQKTEVDKAKARPDESPAGASQPLADPLRMLDVNRHGQRLRDIHLAIVEINSNCTVLQDYLKTKVEESIRDLSICILSSKETNVSLDEQMRRFDDMAAKLKKQQLDMAERMANVKTLCKELEKR